jgi:hypothetical protein
MPVSLYDPQCPGARAYKSLTLELIRRTSSGAETKNQDGGNHGA